MAICNRRPWSEATRQAFDGSTSAPVIELHGVRLNLFSSCSNLRKYLLSGLGDQHSTSAIIGR